MPRLSIKIRRLHKDSTECKHKITPSGKPREGEDCPGVGGYDATCSGCPWTRSRSLRVVIEDDCRSHRDDHQRGRIAVSGDGGTQ